jgi:predicted GIY-YIG superfamily endonuclease
MVKRKLIHGTQRASDFTEKEKAQVVETIEKIMFGSIEKGMSKEDAIKQLDYVKYEIENSED